MTAAGPAARLALPDHLHEPDLVEPAFLRAAGAARMMTGQALVVCDGVVVAG